MTHLSHEPTIAARWHVKREPPAVHLHPIAAPGAGVCVGVFHSTVEKVSRGRREVHAPAKDEADTWRWWGRWPLTTTGSPTSACGSDLIHCIDCRHGELHWLRRSERRLGKLPPDLYAVQMSAAETLDEWNGQCGHEAAATSNRAAAGSHLRSTLNLTPGIPVVSSCQGGTRRVGWAEAIRDRAATTTAALARLFHPDAIDAYKLMRVFNAVSDSPEVRR